MKIIKCFVAYAAIWVCASSAAADNADEKDRVVKVFKEYMEAYSNSDFDKAASYVHPRHLSDYRKYTLPVLVEAKHDPRRNQHPIVKAFFDGVPDGQARRLTGREVSAHLDYAMTTYLPAILDTTRLDRIQLTSVDFLDDGRARIHYNYRSNGGDNKPAKERLAKYDGEWRILLPVPPKQAADELQDIL